MLTHATQFGCCAAKVVSGMKLLFLMTLALVQMANASAAEECGYPSFRGGTVFTLGISRSFEPDVRFQLCKRVPVENSFMLVATDRTHDEIFGSIRAIPLTEKSFNLIYGLYDKSLGFDLRDDTSGFDGSLWCLETKRGSTSSKSCFWTPEHEPEKRKLVGLWNLGVELWRIADFKPSFGELY